MPRPPPLVNVQDSSKSSTDADKAAMCACFGKHLHQRPHLNQAELNLHLEGSGGAIALPTPRAV
jgi:hypothetical protein